MTTALAIPETIPKENADLRGQTVPSVLRSARAYMGVAAGGLSESVRRMMHVLDGDAWRDPQKYGRDVADPDFSFEALAKLTRDDVCLFVIGVRYAVAHAIWDSAMRIGWEPLRRLTDEAVRELARAPDAAPIIAQKLDGKPLMTRLEVREVIRPYLARPKRARLPVSQDERVAFERRLADIQDELRKAQRTERQAHRKLKDSTETITGLRGQLTEARAEIAELQKRLYAK